MKNKPVDDILTNGFISFLIYCYTENEHNILNLYALRIDVYILLSSKFFVNIVVILSAIINLL